MLRKSAITTTMLLAFAGLICGCGGGDGDSDGGDGTPVGSILGDWVGTMEHRIVDYNNSTDTTISYTIVFYILSQDGNQVRGKMQMRDATHVGDLSGTMDGTRFRGVRTGAHTVTIEFTVHGNTLTGTFRYSGDGLDEWGTYTCTKR